jgi:hypothetical protein
MANTAKWDERKRSSKSSDIDEDDTLREVGEEHDLMDLDDDADHPSDRRRDPLRQPE